MRKLKNEELDRLSPEEFREAEKLPVCLVLDNIRSMHNVGAAFRTADAFRIEKIVLCGITGQPPHREINKSALGATETVSWLFHKEVGEAIEMLKKEGYHIAAIEQADDSQELHEFAYKDHKWALVFGNEVFGVSEEVVQEADAVLEIPQFGSKHSLNVSVSIGVVLWDYFLKEGNKKVRG